MKDLLEGFDELSAEIDNDRDVRLRSGVLSSLGTTPEQAARANTLSDKVGQPFGVVAANLDAY